MALRGLVAGPPETMEPVESEFLLTQIQQQVSATGIGFEDPDSVGGYIYRDLDQPRPPVDPTLPVSNIYDRNPQSARTGETPDAYLPNELSAAAWSRGEGPAAQSGITPASPPRPVGDQVPFGIANEDTGYWSIGAMAYPSEYGISELVSVTPEKQPILLGPAGKIGMGWPQTVTTPPWIDIGDQTPDDVIGLGAGYGSDEGSIGPNG